MFAEEFVIFQKEKTFIWWCRIAFLKGFFLLVAGLFFLLYPEVFYFLTSYVMIAALSGVLILTGILGSCFFMLIRKYTRHWVWGFSLGVLTIFIGFLLFLYSGDIQAFAIPVLIGIWMFFEGIYQLKDSFNFKSSGYKYWFVSFLFSFLIVGCSLFVFLRPEVGMYVFAYWIALFLILKGVSDIFVSVELHKEKKEILNTFIDAEFIEIGDKNE